MQNIPKPTTADYNPYYANYIEQVGDQNIEEMLHRNLKEVPEFLHAISEDKWHYRYDKGKWSIAEVIMHLIDAEQIFAYRVLRIARGDTTPLAGFDQEMLVQTCGVENRSKYSVIEEYKVTRKATLALLRGLTEESFSRKGNASGKDISVNALCYIIAGHEAHHISVLKERYLK